MAHLYDLMLLLDAAAPEERRQEILAEVQGMIGDGGAVDRDPRLGQPAADLRDRPSARGGLQAAAQFEGENELLDRLNHSLRIMDGVLRFRIIRQKPGGPEVPPRPEPLRAGGRADEPEGRVAARAAADAAPEPVDAE